MGRAHSCTLTHTSKEENTGSHYSYFLQLVRSGDKEPNSAQQKCQGCQADAMVLNSQGAA